MSDDRDMPDRAGWIETLPLLTAAQRRDVRSVFRRALVESPMPTMLTDPTGVLLGSNEQFATLLGVHEAELLGRSIVDYIHADDRAAVAAAVDQLRARDCELVRHDARLVRPDGRLVWVRGHATRVDGPAGDGASYLVGVLEDATRERFAQQQAQALIEIGTSIAAGDPIEETAGRLAALATARWNSVGLTLTVADPVRRVLTPVRHRLMPPGLYDAFGDIPIGPSGPSCAIAAWSNDYVAIPDMLTDERTAQMREQLADFGIVASWSTPLRDQDGRVVGTLGLYHDQPSEPTREDWRTISDVAGVASIAILADKRRRASRDEQRRMRVDSSTGLPNELALLENIDAVAAAGGALSLAVVAARGPAAMLHDRKLRDRVLAVMAERAQGLAGIVTIGVSGLASLVILARGEWSDRDVNLLHRVLARALDVESITVQPQISIGAVTTEGEMTLSATDLLAHAKSVVPPNPGTALATSRTTPTLEPALAAEVSRALQLGEFVVHYQPQFDLTSGELIGSEALVRWQHPTRGLLAPGEFLPAVEAIGATAELAFTVARLVAAEEQQRADVGLHGPVSINFTATDLLNASLVHFLLDGDTQLWKQMTIELTESQFADVNAVRALEELAAHGFAIALDDFGTGYSALSALHALPLSVVKIDRSFVERLPDDPAADALIAAMTALCSQLAIVVVAEGVETQEQMASLRSLGCTRAQGFLFSRPLPLSEHGSETLRMRLPRTGNRRRPPAVVDDAVKERIVQLRSEGASPHTIAAALNREGRRTSAGARWTARAVSLIAG